MHMSLLTPYKPLLVTTVDQYHPEAVLPGEPYALALEVDLTGGAFNENNAAAFIQGNQPFLLLINRHTNFVDPRITEICLLCLFSKSYIRMGGAPVIAFLDTENAGGEAQRSLFCEYLVSRLQAQGWPSILQWHLSPGSLQQQLEQKKAAPLLVEQLDVDHQYLEQTFFSGSLYVNNYVFFRGDHFRDSLQLERDFAALCNGILKGNRLLQTSLQEYLKAKSTANDLEVKTSRLEEKLQNAEKTISVIRTKYKDDYEQLFKWYHNEYEILPLWYKRFGHVLKVVLGKRTFRSLFNDHVKKYNT
jgi:hypothetical protein